MPEVGTTCGRPFCIRVQAAAGKHQDTEDGVLRGVPILKSLPASDHGVVQSKGANQQNCQLIRNLRISSSTWQADSLLFEESGLLNG